MIETEAFKLRPGFATLSFRRISIGVFFIAITEKDEMNGHEVDVYHDVQIDRNVVYASPKKKLHRISERLTNALEENLLRYVQKCPHYDDIWLDNPEPSYYVEEPMGWEG